MFFKRAVLKKFAFFTGNITVFQIMLFDSRSVLSQGAKVSVKNKKKYSGFVEIT